MMCCDSRPVGRDVYVRVQGWIGPWGGSRRCTSWICSMRKQSWNPYKHRQWYAESVPTRFLFASLPISLLWTVSYAGYAGASNLPTGEDVFASWSSSLDDLDVSASGAPVGCELELFISALELLVSAQLESVQFPSRAARDRWGGRTSDTRTAITRGCADHSSAPGLLGGKLGRAIGRTSCGGHLCFEDQG